MKLRKMIRALALILFAGLFLLSAYMIFSYLGESHAQEAAFDELEEVVVEAQTPPSPAPTADEDSGEPEAPAMLPGYAQLVLCQEKVQIKYALLMLSYPAKASALSSNAA